jgi:hypothetical protein
MPDSVATTQTFDRAGNIGADYPGHVHARAFDLDLPVNGQVIADENRIQWKRVFDGIGRGGLYATQQPGDTQTLLTHYAQSPNGVHSSQLTTYADNANLRSTQVEAKADNQYVTLIDGDGASDTLRGAGLQSFTFTPSGGWSTALWPGAGVGPTGGGPYFDAISRRALVLCWATAYTVSGGTPIVEVYVNGNYVGDMRSNAGNAVNVRLMLSPCNFALPVVPGTRYYVWFRIVAANSQDGDIGGITVIQ